MTSNPLQNPWMVAIIAIAAAGTAYLQFGDRLRRPPHHPTPVMHPAGSVAVAPRDDSRPGLNPAPAVVPVDAVWGINLAYINPRFRKWVEAPNRDPFGQYPKGGPTNEVTSVVTNAPDVLRLTAIWRQSGDRLAVINNLVAGEGTVIQGYRIDRIEADWVRVIGARGAEEIRIRSFEKSPSTNPPPQAPGPAVAAATR
jgi:hypothetical protein